MQDLSTIKTNILKYIEYKGISKYRFYKETGITRGVLDQNNGMSEENTARIIAHYTEINPEWLLTGKGNMLRDDNPPLVAAKESNAMDKGIPLIPISGFAGFGSQAFQDLQVEHYYEVPEFKQADFLMRIKGNSMYPKYSSGDIVACSIIQETLFFQWNKIYALYTKSQGVLVKRVKPSKIKDHILLVSDNTQYDPFDVPVADICKIALVIGVIRLE